MVAFRHHDKSKWMYGLFRYIRKNFVIPFRRQRQAPHIIARGVAVGMAVAFTPTVGFQILLILAIYGIARFLRWRFNLFLAIAFSFVNNPVFAAVFYFFFYVIGNAFIGLFVDSDFIAFDDILATVLHDSGGDFEKTNSFSEKFFLLYDVFSAITIYLWENFVTQILIGSIPCSILAGICSYTISLNAARKIQTYRNNRNRNKNKLSH